MGIVKGDEDIGLVLYVVCKTCRNRAAYRDFGADCFRAEEDV